MLRQMTSFSLNRGGYRLAYNSIYVNSRARYCRLSRPFSESKDKAEDENSQKKKKSKSAKGGVLGSILGGGSSKTISLREAKMIFGVEEPDQCTPENVLKKWEHLSNNNDPDNGGSPYLFHKIMNAKNKLAEHLQIKIPDLKPKEKKEGDDSAQKKEGTESSKDKEKASTKGNPKDAKHKQE